MGEGGRGEARVSSFTIEYCNWEGIIVLQRRVLNFYSLLRFLRQLAISLA